jgi:O-antigen ligase
MTLSRGGAAAMVIALIAFFVLYPRRLRALATAIIAGAGSVLLIASLTQRDALEDALGNSAALSQGDEMLAVVLVVCVGVGLVTAALALAVRYGLVPAVRPSRMITRRVAAIAAAAALIVAVVAVASGEVSSRWDEFKATGVEDARAGDRFASANGNNRYQYWETALDANATNPLVGIGPGTYETYWTRERPWALNIRDAHSLYLENLAELGIVGFLLIVVFVGGVIVVGARYALRGAAAQRPWLAAATAACVAFAVAAGVDWAWEQAVLPIAFLLLAGGLVAYRREDEAAESVPHPVRTRVGWGLAAVIAIAAISIPLGGTKLVRASQDDVNHNQVGSALSKAQLAGDTEPWAGTPALQEALVLELDGQFAAGAAAARDATEDDPDDWQTWFVLSRLEARAGNAEAAVDAYRHAKELNPQSPLFSG